MTQQPDIKEIAATEADSCLSLIASHCLCQSQRVALEHTTKTAANKHISSDPAQEEITSYHLVVGVKKVKPED